MFEREQAERQLAESREREQRRLGSELHDTISQELTGITMMAERLSEELGEVRSPMADEMRSLVAHLSRTRGKVHALSRGLLPVEIEAAGVRRALEAIAASTRKLHGLDCRVHGDASVDVEDEVVANHLIRIARESVQNTVKHAQAEAVEITLTQRGSLVALTIEDDGTGFSKPRVSEGLGLRLMRHRAAAIGAELTIVSRPGRGTRVRCVWRP